MNSADAFNTLHELKAAGKDRKTSRGIIWLAVGIIGGFALLVAVLAIIG